MMRQLMIVNPCAGRRQALKRLTELIALTQPDGAETQLYKTRAPGDAREVVCARAREFDRVLCVGGDGTLNEVIAGMLDAACDVPIGYIPAGSTNDLAASHGLSRDLLQAARDVAEGEALPIDVGAFNGRCFVYTASFGAFTRASYAAPQKVKNALGHLAYILEGAKDLTRIRPYRLSVEANGATLEAEYIFGALSNSTSMGGVLQLDPHCVDLHDGKFEVLLVRAPEHIGQLISAAAALKRGEYDHELLCFLQAGSVRIAAAAEMSWTLDGEYQPGAERIEVENLHDAVRLIVPRRIKKEEAECKY